MKDMEFNLSGSGLRIAIIALLAAFVYAIIAIQLWNVQIRSGEEHRDKVSKQYARKIRMPAVRGRIFSADNRLLADNRPSYNVLFHLSEMRRPGRRAKTIDYVLEEAERLGNAIGRDSKLRASDVSAHMNMFPGIPMTVFMDLDPKELGRAAEISPEIDGMEISPEPVREYPEHGLAANVVGYVGPDDPKLAEDRSEFFYYIPDMVGRSGIERAFDDTIRGSPGKKLVIVNHKGFVHEVVGKPTPAQSGNDVILTIDSKAQRAAERFLEGLTGAMVILDANTGAVLTMATSPSYDPSVFVPKVSRRDWAKLNLDPRRPMFNRPALGTYTPGSIMKPIVSVALLENGLSPSLEVVCDGGTIVGNTRVKCASWKIGGHGAVNIEHAIERSCNDFFIENGMRLGMDRICETLATAGIGSRTGFQLPEGSGHLPSRESLLKREKRKWNILDTAFLSIGQGEVMVTPLQVAVYTAAIANGGTLWKPFIVSEAKDSDGNVIFRQRPGEAGKLAVSPANLDIVRRGMHLSVNSPLGSSKFAKNSKVDLSGKTGTAEMSSRGERYTNTWFIGFGRIPDGRMISIVVFVEHGSSGGRTCAPLAAKVLKEWLPDPETAKQDAGAQ